MYTSAKAFVSFSGLQNMMKLNSNLGKKVKDAHVGTDIRNIETIIQVKYANKVELVSED
jgi:hypothetical protein